MCSHIMLFSRLLQHPISTPTDSLFPYTKRFRCLVPACPEAEGWSREDASLLRAADELHADSRIGDATWAALAERYDEAQLIELCMVVGQYHLVAFTLNSLGVQAEPGLPEMPERSA